MLVSTKMVRKFIVFVPIIIDFSLINYLINLFYLCL